MIVSKYRNFEYKKIPGDTISSSPGLKYQNYILLISRLILMLLRPHQFPHLPYKYQPAKL